MLAVGCAPDRRLARPPARGFKFGMWGGGPPDMDSLSMVLMLGWVRAYAPRARRALVPKLPHHQRPMGGARSIWIPSPRVDWAQPTQHGIRPINAATPPTRSGFIQEDVAGAIFETVLSVEVLEWPFLSSLVMWWWLGHHGQVSAASPRPRLSRGLLASSAQPPPGEKDVDSVILYGCVDRMAP
ncbi:hypothetical protein NL676_018785 [Syzygium grande]|nr:hypothetical protein NL676_018785 [Syzygium grande]